MIEATRSQNYNPCTVVKTEMSAKNPDPILKLKKSDNLLIQPLLTLASSHLCLKS